MSVSINTSILRGEFITLTRVVQGILCKNLLYWQTLISFNFKGIMDITGFSEECAFIVLLHLSKDRSMLYFFLYPILKF
jgi:hypothetical protein